MKKEGGYRREQEKGVWKKKGNEAKGKREKERRGRGGKGGKGKR